MPGSSGDFVRQELQGDEAMEASVLGLVNHTHPAAAELLDDAVVRDGLADHCGNAMACGQVSQCTGSLPERRKESLRKSGHRKGTP